MRSMQCNVEFGYQLSIRSGTKEITATVHYWPFLYHLGTDRVENTASMIAVQTWLLAEPLLSNGII
jgi:hypothetical protein